MSKQFTDISFTLPATEWARQYVPPKLFGQPKGSDDPTAALKSFPGLQGWYDENVANREGMGYKPDDYGNYMPQPGFNLPSQYVATEMPSGAINNENVESYLKSLYGPNQDPNSTLGLLYNNSQVQQNLPYLPTYKDGNVTWYKPKVESGFLDKAAEFVGPALAAGVGGLSGGFGLSDFLNGFGADAPWGVNPQTGGSMDLDWLGQIGDYGAGGSSGNLGSLFSSGGNVLEEMGNVTGGGFLNSNYTLGQVANSLGISPDKLAQQAAQKGASSVLGKLLNGSATGTDLASLLGALGATGLGVLGSNKQSDALTQIANQSRSDRAPFLNTATGWLNNPESYYSGEPAQAAMKGVLHGLSVNSNPANNPTAMATATEAGLRNWQNAVTGFGNIGLAGEDTRSQLLSGAATADRGVTSSLASGLGTLTQPQNDLDSMLRRLQSVGLA